MRSVKIIDFCTDTTATLNGIVSYSYYGMLRGKLVCVCPRASHNNYLKQQFKMVTISVKSSIVDLKVVC